jgi:ribosomal RNA-processing protein 12
MAIAPAFQKRSDLRTPICNALRRLASQSRQAMRYHGQTIGHADPTVTMEESENNKHASSMEDDLLAEEEHDTVPTTISLETAQNAVNVLQKDAETWLPLLLNSFVTSPANQRGHIGAAVAAYACICDPSSVATLFRAAIMKLMKVQEQMRSGELGREAVFEGGESDTERVCTFMEAALLLAGGLDIAGIQVLWKAAIPGTKEKDPAIQKKSYKIIAYLCESRQDFVQSHFTDVLRILLKGTGTAVSAAKRYRLRCLKASILELITWEGEDIDLSSLTLTLPGLDDDDEEERSHFNSGASGARLVITPMVTEIILCVKEANKRTRAAAFDLLIDVATAMHEAEPPIININEDDGTTEKELPAAASASAHGGGLHSLVTIVLGGLIGSTPHMISASVMALARLLFEFAPVLAGLVPTLLPSVLLLLRSKAREVIKAVLGFVKVVVMRLPTADLLKFTPAICEGILLWAEDSKNKFRLKVRVILERIARRCGFEALEAAVPEAHRALLTHIRKQHHRKERKKNNNGASEMDWNAAGVDDDADADEEDGRSRKSKAGTARTARTAAKSAWNSEMFSDEEDDTDLGLRGGGGGGGRSEGGRTMRTAGGKSGVTGSRSIRSAAHQNSGKYNGRRLPSSGDDPIDLLDAGVARKMVRGGGAINGGAKSSAKDIVFETNKDGRMVIREEVPLIGKRKRSNNDAADAGFDSGDSDFEDLKGYSGLTLALKGSKSVAQTQNIAASLGGKSLGAKSMGGRSHRTSATGTGDKKQNRHGGQHTGDRFKAKKSGAGGDIKGSSKVEPYAYWPLDRKMLNRRVQKTKTAKSGLDRVVSAAKAGTAKGQKAKRARN